MRNAPSVSLGLLAAVILVVSARPSAADLHWSVTPLTNNSYNEVSPQISGSNVVWMGHDGDDLEIFLYDGTETKPLTNNDHNDSSPQVSGSNVVWKSYDGWDEEIFVYDGTETKQLTNDRVKDWFPQVSGSNVVWCGGGRVVPPGLTHFEIFLYDGAETKQLTSNSYYDWRPQVDGSNVVWVAGPDGTGGEIYLYDGSTTKRLTENDTIDEHPRVSGGNVVWRQLDRSGGHDLEIWLYDGTKTTQLTDNTYHECTPQVSGSNVVWVGDDGHDQEIFLYDGAKTTQLTDNSYDDHSPQVSGSNVVWRGDDGHDGEIFLYDGTETWQLTDNYYDDRDPQVDGDRVVWQGYDGNDLEIYLAELKEGEPADIVMEWVPVGDARNPADTRYATPGYGRVDYEYHIGKYEVTNAQYCEFLNAVATVRDPHRLYHSDMGGGWQDIGGISRTGSGTDSDPWIYSVRSARANRPVNFVSFWDACRFANWLHNGKPVGSQDLASTEDGAYCLNGITNPENTSITREPDAEIWIPSQDEWHKAAYYDPNYGGPGVGGYWDVPTRSHMLPTADPPPGTDLIKGSANYDDLGLTYHTTVVGAYTTKPSNSAYGTFDQAGNVSEWNDTICGFPGEVETPFRRVRGGNFGSEGSQLTASWLSNSEPHHVWAQVGFRVGAGVVPMALPVADAGGARTIGTRTVLLLDASGSTDPDHDIVSYKWDLDDDGAFETDAGSDPVFFASSAYLDWLGLGLGGPYDIHLRVADGGGRIATDSTTLTIVPAPCAAALGMIGLGMVAWVWGKREGKCDGFGDAA